MFNWLKKPAFLIFILAVFLRFFYVYFFLGINTPPNEHDFWQEKIAFNLSKGGGFGLVPFKPTARKLPLFPLFLSGIYYLFGHNLPMARLFQILLGAFSASGIYLISRMLYDEKKAILSGLFLACDPLYIYLSGWFLTENLFIPLIIFFLYFIIKYQVKEQNQKLLVIAGILLGLAAITRASLTLFPFFIFLWSYFFDMQNLEFSINPKILKNTLIISGIMYLFVSFWALRNYVVLGETIITETGGGRMFWGANNSEATGDVILMTGSPRLYEASERPRGESGKNWREWEGSPWLNVFLSTSDELSEKLVDKKYYDKGWEWIKTHPGDFFLLIPRKLYYLFKFWSPHASFPDLARGLFIFAEIYYYIILFIACAGLFLSFSQWKKYLIFYLLLGNFMLSTMLFFGDARQRMPILPVIVLLSGLGAGKIFILNKLPQGSP
ncbi:glycosyltransferase family 39 protein [Candidatus Desantisbacteria bacterium]|nr:glycosyltransferase family 39 protein [Candidatus Desantisbacteria bacterium]